MDINKESLDEFRKDFEKAVKELEAKYSVDISLGRISYQLNEFHSTVNVRKKGLTTTEWNRYCGQYGFTPEDLGKRFTYNRKVYTITGIKKGNKYPILTKRDDGKKYSFAADACKNLF